MAYGKLYINQGTVDGSWQGMGSGSSIGDGTDLAQSMQLGDVNGDGYLDAIVGNNDQPIRVYENSVNDTPITLNQVVGSSDFVHVKFVPDANWNGTTTLAYKAADFDGGTSAGAANVSINIDVVNDAPRGQDNTVTMLEDGTYTLKVSDFGFSDPNDDPANSFASVKITDLPAVGSMKLNGSIVHQNDGISVSDITADKLTYTPVPNANGDAYAHFGFAVMDNGGTLNGGVNTDALTKTMTINVTAVNDAPVANTDSYTTAEDTPLVVATLQGLLANDSDVEGSALTASVVTDPTHGTLALNTNGSFTYTPTLNYNGPDSFTYKVNDGTVDGNTATVNLTVTAVNDAPTSPIASAVTATEDTQYTFKMEDFSFADIEGSSLQKVKITVAETAGTLKYNGNDVVAPLEIAIADIAKLKFDPALNTHGSNYSTFKFMMSDGTDYSVSDYTMTINVTAVNDAPVLSLNNGIGSLDTTFGGDGKVTTDFGGGNDDSVDIAILADGKIVVAGSSGGDIALARYNSDGSLDTTFSGDGKLTTNFSSYDVASSLAIQADGKIVVAGIGGGDFALARYNSDGTLDTTFDGDGKVTTDFGGSTAQALSLGIQSDGKIVVAGTTWDDFALARYNSNGTLDTTFDGDGKVTTDFGSKEDYANSLAIQSDGKIVVAGSSSKDKDTYADFALARYNSDGTLDTTFDGDGKLTTVFGANQDYAYSVAIQADGKIVAAGTTLDGSDFDFALARYGYAPPMYLAYTENAGDQEINNSITLTDSDNTNMASAKIQITGNSGNYLPEDTLSIDPTYLLGDVHANFEAGILILTGSTTKANYESMLEHVTYTNSSDSPNTSPRTVTWTVTDDGMVNSVPQTSTITVTAVNDAPTASGPVATTSLNEDGSTSITVYGTDVDNPALSDVSFAVTSSVSHGNLVGGTASLDSAGHYSKVYTYTPNTNFNGSDSFAFTFTTKSETSSATDTTSAVSVPITVNALNDLPTDSGPISTTTLNEDSTVSITVHGTDVDNPALTDVSFAITSDVHNGTLVAGSTSLDSAGHYSKVYTYTPISNFNGSDNFAFTFTTKSETSSSYDTTTTVSVPITVNALNHAPTAFGSSVDVTENNSVRIVLSGQDTDVGQSLTFHISSLPANGDLYSSHMNAQARSNPLGVGQLIDNEVWFRPDAGDTTDTSFQYRVQDNGTDQLFSNFATISLNVSETPTPTPIRPEPHVPSPPFCMPPTPPHSPIFGPHIFNNDGAPSVDIGHPTVHAEQRATAALAEQAAAYEQHVAEQIVHEQHVVEHIAAEHQKVVEQHQTEEHQTVEHQKLLEQQQSEQFRHETISETKKHSVENDLEKTGSHHAAALVGFHPQTFLMVGQHTMLVGNNLTFAQTIDFTGARTQVELNLVHGNPTASFTQYLNETAKSPTVPVEGS